jgi:hypothetical protein
MSEHTEQAALFEWAAWHQSKAAALNMLYAVPNGGKRDKRTAAMLKAEGVKAGVPDVFLPVARQGYHGFYIEMKVGRNKTSDEQKAWLAALEAEGYYTAVAYDWTAAARALVEYLGRDAGEFGL